jgi:23S rRNA pseudouridine1911/1915/1917 synthase
MSVTPWAHRNRSKRRVSKGAGIPATHLATTAGLCHPSAMPRPPTFRRPAGAPGAKGRAPKASPVPDALGARPSERTLASLVREQTGVAWTRARRLCTEGRVTLDGERCLDPAARVPPGGVVAVDQGARKLRAGPLPESAIVHFDRDLVIVAKPVGMLSIADEAGNKATLVDHLRTMLRRMDPRGIDARLGVVHRLDKDTGGLMVFTRTAHAKRELATQFREHTIDRVYHAIAHGHVATQRVESYLLLDRGDGVRGSHGVFRRASGAAPPEAKRAVTHIGSLVALAGATLVECRLETGRQHQIRIHLAELGHPLVGERVYMRDYEGPVIPAARPMLHARMLGFTHPRTGERMSFQCEAPADFEKMIDALRLRATPPSRPSP